MITAFTTNPELRRKPDESELSYVWRVGKMKDDGIINMTWSELAEVINRQFREPDEYYSESAYRKKYALLRDAAEQIFTGGDSDEYHLFEFFRKLECIGDHVLCFLDAGRFQHWDIR